VIRKSPWPDPDLVNQWIEELSLVADVSHAINGDLLSEAKRHRSFLRKQKARSIAGVRAKAFDREPKDAALLAHVRRCERESPQPSQNEIARRWLRQTGHPRSMEAMAACIRRLKRRTKK